MYKFIYVFNRDIAMDLVEQGFALIKSDDERRIYVLENKATQTFSLSKNDFVFSSTLTF